MTNLPMPIALPWIELAIVVSLVGAVVVACIKDAQHAARWCLAFASITLACTLVSMLGFFGTTMTDVSQAWSFEEYALARPVLAIDEVNVLLLPTVALMHFLTALATPRTKMARFSFTWVLGLGAIRLATFACIEPWVLIGLLALGALPPYFELLNRGKPTRMYVIHMSLFLGLLVFGWGLVQIEGAPHSGWAVLPVLLAILVRSGAVPTHCWLTDYFEHGTFGTALLLAAPVVGVYAVVRLVLPIAPDWILQSMGVVSLVTAVYAAGMALVQREARRFFAFFFLSHASLVLVGLELSNANSLTGALTLWFSVALSLTGLGLTLRALEARFGRMSLRTYHGYYRQTPTLAMFFFITGLASIGFPGTLGFVSSEMLVDGAVAANRYVGFGLVLTAALNGIAVVRVYLLLFTGTEHAASVPLHTTLRERIAVLTLATLIFGGGLFPQPGVATCNRAAEAILRNREQYQPEAIARARH